MLAPRGIIFQGKAGNVILPGEKGVFEVMAHHRRLLSRLLSGLVQIDGRVFRIQRGVARVSLNKITLIVEES